jgi:3-oxoacyl-[acyl-carrier-protein] synthase III
VKTNAYISYINYFLPEMVEKNIDLESEFPGKINPDLIEKLGVSSRHIATNGMKASDMGVIVAEKLFTETGFDKNKIDALIYCSLSHDYITPATSCVIQKEIGLGNNIATFDLNHGCSGYVYCLALAKSIMHTLDLHNVLIITSTVSTKYVHPKNLSIRLLFGDASAATILSTVKGISKDSIGEFVFGTDGAGYKKIIIRDGADANPTTTSSFEEKKDQFGNIYTDGTAYMDGAGIFLFIIKKVPQIIEETLEKNNLTKNDIDLYILHQANYMALEKVREKLSLERERFFYSMETTGNTIQSTIPIAIKEAMKQGKIKKGSKVLIAGFGTGISWAATVLTF